MPHYRGPEYVFFFWFFNLADKPGRFVLLRFSSSRECTIRTHPSRIRTTYLFFCLRKGSTRKSYISFCSCLVGKRYHWKLNFCSSGFIYDSHYSWAYSQGAAQEIRGRSYGRSTGRGPNERCVSTACPVAPRHIS
jgi:hypothetical protein